MLTITGRARRRRTPSLAHPAARALLARHLVRSAERATLDASLALDDAARVLLVEALRTTQEDAAA